jgi:hypothetical protein
VAPDIVKPVPVSVAALTVTGEVPVEVKVTDCVAGVFRTTSPKATLVALTPSTGVSAFDSFNCKAKLFETLAALAVKVTVCADVKDATVALNPALVAPAGTATVAGTVTVALLLATLTLWPPLGAAALRVTVQASVPAPVMDALPQESALSTGVPVPVTGVPVSVAPDPLKPIATFALALELLVMVN